MHIYESIQTPLLDNLVYIVKLHAKPVLMHMSAKVLVSTQCNELETNKASLIEKNMSAVVQKYLVLSI
jgi:hypothetical protein